MAGVSITPRTTPAGNRRYVVRYRRGGRFYPLEHGGSFPTLREARLRRDLVAGELAAGRDPGDAIRATVPGPVLTVAAWRERFLASRIDVDETTRKTYRAALSRVEERFGTRPPATLTAAEVAGWVSDLAESLSPGTCALYLAVFRLLLDYADCDPNPARDPRVKLPKRTRKEARPPSADHFLVILSAVPSRFRLPVLVLEQGGLRIGEAVGLSSETWTRPGRGYDSPPLRRSVTGHGGSLSPRR